MSVDNKFEFGDFQTPLDAAREVVSCLYARGVSPASIVEPTCGVGNFLAAAAERFAGAHRVFGLEVNEKYLAEARGRVPNAELTAGRFFDFDWSELVRTLPEPILVVGNPPWVTASGLAARGGNNLPEKSNFQGRRGLDAKTGKANFDIAEWMLIQLVDAVDTRDVTIAMLLKTGVARKVLHHAWKTRAPMRRAAIYEFDAAKHFGVSVAACLLVCEFGKGRRATTASCFGDLSSKQPHHRIGWENGFLIADANARQLSKHLEINTGSRDWRFRWRSGVKHDCSRIMEFRLTDNGMVNGLQEVIDIEETCLFPLLKGSDVAKGRKPSRWMLVPQRRTGDNTEHLANTAPRTWNYLVKHGAALDRRGSSIYKKRPRFSVFGIGDYTFAPWKVAICGLYKSLNFRVVGLHDGRAVVFDDTVYLLSFTRQDEAEVVAELLRSELATAFFRASVFWDNKRPITAEMLNRLDLELLARELNVELPPQVEPTIKLGDGVGASVCAKVVR